MWIVAAAIPLLLFLAWVVVATRRSQEAARSWRPAEIAAFVLAGYAIALPACWVEQGLARLTSISPRNHVAGAWGAALASLFVFVPLEEGIKLLVGWRLFKWRAVQSPRRATLYATCLALGFATHENVLYLREAHAAGLLVIGFIGAGVLFRALLATVARALAAAFWGYTLGRAAARRSLDGVLVATWTAASAVRALCDHLVFGRGPASLLAAMPLYAGMLAVGYLGAKQLWPARRREETGNSLTTSFPSVSPPSLAQMRMALRRAERPIMLLWIVIGMLVTMGVNLACVIGAVFVGRRLGLDFSAIDEGEITGVAPVALVGMGVLVAFPVAGFLIARASGTSSVLEAALAAGLAIVGTLVMLGLAAPVAIVFALAFAPIAFGLACAGAWLGIEHA